jgi:uncharacterized protein (DUF2141 family)
MVLARRVGRHGRRQAVLTIAAFSIMIACRVLLMSLWAGTAVAQGAPSANSSAAADAPPADPPAAVQSGATLTVIVTGVAESRGQLLVTVFTSKEGWPKPKHAAATARVPARAPETEVRIDGLPAGPCAVAVVHDLDENGKLTMRWFPYPHPAEPTGASNGASGNFGPPSFDAARFGLPPGGRTTRIALRP